MLTFNKEKNKYPTEQLLARSIPAKPSIGSRRVLSHVEHRPYVPNNTLNLQMNVLEIFRSAVHVVVLLSLIQRHSLQTN